MTKKILYLIIFLGAFNFSKSQENSNLITEESKSAETPGSIFINKINGKLYFKKNDCVDNAFYNIVVDKNDFKATFPKWMSMNDAVAFYEITTPAVFSNVQKYTDQIFNKGNDSYTKIVNRTMSGSSNYYIERLGYPVSYNQSNEYFETQDGFFKIDQSSNFNITFKENNATPEKIIFEANLTEINKSNFCSFSYDSKAGKVSYSIKTDTGFKIRIYDVDQKLTHPDDISSAYPYNYISERQLLILVDKKSIESFANNLKIENDKLKKDIDQMSSSSITASYAETQRKKWDAKNTRIDNLLKSGDNAFFVRAITKLKKKGSFSKIDEDMSEYSPFFDDINNKNFINFIKKGGLSEFNDSLLVINNFSDYTFKGYKNGTEQFIMTGNPIDPLKRYNNYKSEKVSRNDLLDVCPNLPGTVDKLVALNDEMDAIDAKANSNKAKRNQFQFITQESSDGITTEIKVLKNCQAFDMNDEKNREIIKESVRNLQKDNLEVFSRITKLIGDYAVINQEIKGCKAESESSGSAALDALSSSISKGGMKASLILITARGTKILELSKKSKEELDNTLKVIESYKKSN